jgi:hypothetical protein
MSDPVSYTEEIAALDQAIASGVTEVTYNGRHTKFDTMEMLLARRRWLLAQQAGGVQQTPQCGFASFDRGDC